MFQAKHNVASDGLGFPLWNFFLQCWMRGSHAGRLSLHNLIWQIWYMPKTWHFTIQTFYGAALCFKHNTAFKEHVVIQPPPQVPRVLLKIYGEKQSASTSWHPILCTASESFLFPSVLSGVARLIPLEIHFSTTPRGWESPTFDLRRSGLKEVSRAAKCDRIIISSDEIMNEKTLGKP